MASSVSYFTNSTVVKLTLAIIIRGFFHHIRRKGRVQHCRIKSKQENGQTKYYLVDQVTFDSLYSLINFYQTHPLKSMNFELTLTDAIPQVINWPIVFLVIDLCDHYYVVLFWNAILKWLRFTSLTYLLTIHLQ